MVHRASTLIFLPTLTGITASTRSCRTAARSSRQKQDKSRRHDHAGTYDGKSSIDVPGDLADRSSGVRSHETAEIRNRIDQRETCRCRIAGQEFIGQCPERTQVAVNAGGDERQKCQMKKGRPSCAHQQKGAPADDGRDCRVVAPLERAVRIPRDYDHRQKPRNLGNHCEETDYAIGIAAG